MKSQKANGLKTEQEHPVFKIWLDKTEHVD